MHQRHDGDESETRRDRFAVVREHVRIVRRGLPLVLALSLGLGACAAVPLKPETWGRSSSAAFEAFKAGLGKAFDDLKGAVTFHGAQKGAVSFNGAQNAARVTQAPRRADTPSLVEAREASDRREYAAALGHVDRVLAAQPQHREAVDLQKAILYRLGKAQFEQERYAESYQTLMRLTKLTPDYEDSAATLRAARDRLVQHHYGEGLRFFGEERVEAAIAEWRLALAYDPQHAAAKRNLEQAERVLKTLEQIRKPDRPVPSREELWRARAQRT